MVIEREHVEKDRKLEMKRERSIGGGTEGRRRKICGNEGTQFLSWKRRGAKEERRGKRRGRGEREEE